MWKLSSKLFVCPIYDVWIYFESQSLRYADFEVDLYAARQTGESHECNKSLRF